MAHETHAHTQNGLTSNEMGMRDLLIHNNCSQNLTGLAHFARFREHTNFFFRSFLPFQTNELQRKQQEEKEEEEWKKYHAFCY